MLRLQRTAGNLAVTMFVQRDVLGEGVAGDRPGLDVGDRGPGVILLQHKLNRLGFHLNPDGGFGGGLHSAVVKFQRDREELHPATGGVGPLTWAALDAEAPDADPMGDPLAPGDFVVVEGYANRKYVVYDDEVRARGAGGTVAWLCRNPGNIRNGDHLGAFPGKRYFTEDVGNFAIFPDEDTGLAAIKSVLHSYGHLTVSQAMNKYAPRGDAGNNPDQYSREVANQMGVTVHTFVDTLSDDQMDTFSLAIRRVEGWVEGTTFARDDPALPYVIRARLGTA